MTPTQISREFKRTRLKVQMLEIELAAADLEIKRLKASDELQECANLLPDSRYMDPPDGGSPTIAEQLKRMIADQRQGNVDFCLKLSNALGLRTTVRDGMRDDILAEIKHLKAIQTAVVGK
jgi:hypothetical protein